MEFFSRSELQHGFSISLLEIPELTLILLADVFRLGAKSVFHAGLALIDPILDLGGRQVELPGSFGNRCFALNNVQNQRAFPPRCPSLNVLVHCRTHVSLSSS